MEQHPFSVRHVDFCDFLDAVLDVAKEMITGPACPNSQQDSLHQGAW
jgi:hypothetical protein